MIKKEAFNCLAGAQTCQVERATDGKNFFFFYAMFAAMGIHTIYHLTKCLIDEALEKNIKLDYVKSTFAYTQKPMYCFLTGSGSD